MGVDMDFSKLSAQDVLDLASYAEREAKQSYDQLAGWMQANGNADAAKFFSSMAVLEQRHFDLISGRRRVLFGDTPPTLTDVPIVAWEIEAPDFDEADVTMTLRRALELSLAAEKNAEAYYAGAIEYATDSRVVDLLDEMRRAEVDHQRMIERHLAKVTE